MVNSSTEIRLAIRFIHPPPTSWTIRVPRNPCGSEGVEATREESTGGDRSGKQLEPELRKMTKDEVNEAGIHEVGD